MIRSFLLPLTLVTLAACGARSAAVGSPATSASPSAAFTLITFERTPCFGTCPVYKVSVNGSGGVRFEGTRNVDSVGVFSGRIDAAAVAALSRAFDDAQYFALDSKYTYGESNCRDYGTDASRILTSLRAGERAKSVEHDLGCGSVPARLAELYRRFDEIVVTSRWIGRR